MEWVIEIKVHGARIFALILLIILITASFVIMVHHPLKTPYNEPNDDENYFVPGPQFNRQTRAGTSWPMHLNNPSHTSYTPDTGPTTDEELWNNSTSGITYGSPAVVDGMVYIGGGDGMNAFYANNGTLAWRTGIGHVEGNTGVSSSPALDNGYVFFGGDNTIYCLWANNGTIKWMVPTALFGSWGDGTPTVANGKVFVGGRDYRLYCIDQQTGNVLWRTQPFSGGPSSNYGLYAAPAVVNGHVYVAAANGYIYKINEMGHLPPPADAMINHSFNSGNSIYSSPLVVNGRVYFGNGYYSPTSTSNRFYCLNATDLSFIWEFYPGFQTSFFSSAGYYNGRIYVGSVDGNFYVLDAMSNGPSTTVYWQYPIGSTWSSPAITNDRLYIGSKAGYLYCFNLTQPGPPSYYWLYDTGGDVDSSPAVSDGKVYVGSQGLGGRIYCLGSSAVPTLDYIIIRTAPDGGGSWVGDSTYLLGDSDIFYAAGYNNSVGWVKDVPALWYSDNTSIGYVAPGPSSSTIFNALNLGTCNITAVYGAFLNTTGVLTIFNYAILKQGWNLISIPLIQEDQSLSKVLESIDGYYDAVQRYDITDTSDAWKHHKVGKSFGNDLSEINEAMGFWIHITQPGDTIFLYNGIQVTKNQSIDLHPGWNLVGYPSLSNRNTISALNNIDFYTEVEAIWTYNATTQKWKKLSESDYFEMGSGYWIYSLVEETWDVPL